MKTGVYYQESDFSSVIPAMINVKFKYGNFYHVHMTYKESKADYDKTVRMIELKSKHFHKLKGIKKINSQNHIKRLKAHLVNHDSLYPEKFI